MRFFIPLLGLVFLLGCSGLEKSEQEKIRKVNAKVEEIYRLDEEKAFSIETPTQRVKEPYPWEKKTAGKYPRITKEYFRCKGNAENPLIKVNKSGEMTAQFDCGGFDKHSLPVREEKEFIYPILIDLLNYVQEKTERKVVITCGHRCPDHNLYADASIKNQSSKHMLGAEVDFYVKGMENKPEEVLKLIFEYYEKNTEDPSYQKFLKSTSGESGSRGVSWYNKEVFIRISDKNEGRDLDNDHLYPYLTIQVLYDVSSKRKVIYSWQEAFNGFMRW